MSSGGALTYLAGTGCLVCCICYTQRRREHWREEWLAHGQVTLSGRPFAYVTEIVCGHGCYLKTTHSALTQIGCSFLSIFYFSSFHLCPSCYLFSLHLFLSFCQPPSLVTSPRSPFLIVSHWYYFCLLGWTATSVLSRRPKLAGARLSDHMSPALSLLIFLCLVCGWQRESRSNRPARHYLILIEGVNNVHVLACISTLPQPSPHVGFFWLHLW